MANIRSGSSERMVSINRWSGLNESPEGEATLSLSEAAVMRNFRVTSGGALKKRPGSESVARLFNEYVVARDKGSRRCLFADRGAAKRTLYPRVTVGDDGKVRLDGEGTEVSTEDSGGYEGYYIEAEGCIWALESVEVERGSGTEPIGGGMATPDEPVRFAVGSESERPEGSSFEGEQSVRVWPEARLTELGAEVTGESHLVPRARFEGTGFETQNVGGYLIDDGRLLKYYGAKMESYTRRHVAKKYRCRLNESGRYYTPSEWIFMRSYEAQSVSGFSDFVFDPESGFFSDAGKFGTYSGEGVCYQSAEFQCTKLSFSQISEGSDTLRVEEWIATKKGPFEGDNFRYIPRECIGDVLVPEGGKPDEDVGYDFVTETTDFAGTLYTVMKRYGTYFMYRDDPDNPTAYGKYVYGWYGCPLATEMNTYRWYFNPVAATKNPDKGRVVAGLWSGFVAGREVLCAACGGYLWELRREGDDWTRIDCGRLDTSSGVHMFGFDGKLYLLGGSEYMVWDGERLETVEGYVPLVSVAAPPEGGGVLLETVNRLTPKRRYRVSPDGNATVFHLPERDIASVDSVRDLVTGAEIEDWTADNAAGTVTFRKAPTQGVSSVEIAWSAKTALRGDVVKMRFSEVYNGAQDTRVFLYGDGSNRAIYSGLDTEGRGRADYFPDLGEVAVGDGNTPLTAMIRHYDKLLAFKLDSAWSIGYDAITLEDGSVTAGFYVAPVNRSIGCRAYGEARLVQNRPRTLDGESVIEWLATGSSGNITGDQRNAERVSQRVERTLRRFDLTRAATFYDKYTHEYYVIGENGEALIQNMDTESWYYYTGFDAVKLINYGDELYFGTRDGYLRRFSDDYLSDDGRAIDAYWESGAMGFGQDYRSKYSAMVWIGIKPEDRGYLEVTAKSDRQSTLAVYKLSRAEAEGLPEVRRVRLKARKFAYYKLIFASNTPDTTVTIVSADMRVRGSGYVK